MNFVGKRNWFFLLSLIVIIPGIVFLATVQLNPGIDFSGGSTLDLQFEDPVTAAQLRSAFADLGQPESIIQKIGDNTFFIRTKTLDVNARETIVSALEASLSPGGITVLAFDQVSAVIARDTVANSLYAVLAAAVGIFIYIWWAFRNLPKPFRYSVAAIIALLHDVGIVVGIFAILGEFADIEVNTMFLIALLTVIGYSVNDTIVVFDRIRENILTHPNRQFSEVVNLSIGETMGRSLNTSLTLLFTLLALTLFGGQTIRTFLFVLLIGVVVGTYSSIAIASQVLVAWEEGDFRKWFGYVRSPRSVFARARAES